MLNFFATLLLVATLAIMISVAVFLFYAAVTEESVVDFIYGAAIDIFSCMLIFGGDTQRVEFAAKTSLMIASVIVLLACLFKKVKDPKEVQN